MGVLSIPDRQRGVLLVFLYFHSGDVLLMTRMHVVGAAYQEPFILCIGIHSTSSPTFCQD